MRKRGAGALLLILAVLAPVAVGAQTGPTLDVNPSQAEPGDTVTANGAGFQPGSVAIYLDEVNPGLELATGTIGSTGRFRLDFRVPRAPDGDHTVIACRDRVNSTCREQATDGLRIGSRSPTTEPPSTTTTTGATTTTATTAVIGTPTTAGPTTTSPPLASPTSIGPDPTFDPDPTGLAAVTTTSGPSFSPNAPTGPYPDLSVKAIEVTQGVQNLASQMPLVAGRRTWVRVHVETDESGQWAPVDGLLLLQRSGRPDKVLMPENGPIGTGNDRTEYHAALNFLLPSDYLGAGSLKITAGVWSFTPETLSDEEPDPSNNLDDITVELHEGTTPTVWLVALDDGAGPGPDITDLNILLTFALVVDTDLKEFHPIKAASFDALADVLGPGPETAVPGLWDLSLDSDLDATAGDRRHEPNIRMSLVAEVTGMLDTGSVLGRFDPDIPSGGFSGWAGYGVSWNKPVAGTPAHELGHTRGLKHVACKDDDDDGVPDELKGGGLDPTHPNGLPPNCSLAPISPNGYFGFTTYRSPVTIYSNDPTHPLAAYPYMSYKGPGWTDPYHWCLLLEAYGIPCSPAAIGVPPKVLKPAADCTPEAIEGFELQLCLIDQLPPPADPGPGPAPEPGGNQGGGQAGGGAGDDEGGSLLVLDGGLAMLGAPAGSGDGRSDLALFLPEADEWAIVAGSVDVAARTASLGEVAQRPGITAAAETRFRRHLQSVLNGIEPASVVLRLLDPAGGMLAHVPVDVEGAGHGAGGDRGRHAGFVQPVPWPAGVATIELLVDGARVATRAVSGSAPSVTEVAAVPGAGETVITWTAADADGDALTARVMWSADGERWVPVIAGVDAGGGRAVVPHTRRLPGGDAVRVRVEANDDVLTGTGESEPFATPGHGPVGAIAGIPDGGEIEQYELLELVAHLLDPEDGSLDGEAVRWSSSRDGDLGAGQVLATRDLSLGDHVVEAHGVDRDGNEVTARVGIRVVERTTPTRYTEEPDPAGVAFLTGADLAGDGGGVSALLVVALAAVIGGGAAGIAVAVRRRRSPVSPG